jgi:hypothetical protein
MMTQFAGRRGGAAGDLAEVVSNAATQPEVNRASATFGANLLLLETG